MARIIDSTVQSRTVSSSFPAIQIIMVGMILGFLFWGVSILLGRYTNSATLPGDVATIIVATVGLAAVIIMRMPRPIIIILSSAATLWGLAPLTSGLSLYETIAWDITLYALVYLLFSWISRYSKAVPVLIVVIAVVIIARITTTL